MSERGSFVTEYVYCKKCFTALKKILLSKEKYFCSQVIESWDGCSESYLPIIAGKVGGSYPHEEIRVFKHELADKIEEVICHPIRISVIPDTEEVGSELIIYKPK